MSDTTSGAQRFPAEAGPAQRAFAIALRQARGSRSQQWLADETSRSRESISLVERCLRWPTRELAERCDAALGTGGTLVGLWPNAARERRQRRMHAKPERPHALGRGTRPVVARTARCDQRAGPPVRVETPEVGHGGEPSWPARGRVTCGRCGHRLVPRPAASVRRCYGCRDACSLGLVDADQLEMAIGAALVRRFLDHFDRFAVNPGPVGLGTRADVVLVGVTINGNDVDGLALVYRWRGVEIVPVPASPAPTPGWVGGNRSTPRLASR